MSASQEWPISIGEIARLTGSNIHQVEYVIRSRGIIGQRKAGNARLFSEADFQQIEAALDHIEARRQGGGL